MQAHISDTYLGANARQVKKWHLQVACKDTYHLKNWLSSQNN